MRSNGIVVELPEDLELLERRKLPRARLNPKEGANVTALTNLFEGVGVNGIMESISEGGCRVRVEKALNIKDEKRLPLGTALLPKGQPFMLLKLNKVPKCPAVMELAGKVAYLDDSGGGLVHGDRIRQAQGRFRQRDPEPGDQPERRGSHRHPAQGAPQGRRPGGIPPGVTGRSALLDLRRPSPPPRSPFPSCPRSRPHLGRQHLSRPCLGRPHLSRRSPRPARRPGGTPPCSV